MADIKTITLPSGNTYDIVDQGARDLIAGLSGSTQYLGVTTTQLVDNVTTSPNIVVAGETVTASAGGIATYGSKEFIYSGTVWQEFGDLSALGDLAYKDSASGSYTPAGSVSKPTFTGSSTTFTGNFTPAGGVSLTNTAKTPSISASAGTSSDKTFQCGGTVGTPTITVTPSTTTVNSITAVGTLPELSMTVANENLTIGWSAGTLPTKGDNTTVATGIQSATSTQPTFTGSYVKLANGSIDVPTSASFSGTEGAVSVSGTPNGDVSKPTFSGTAATITVE